MEIDVTVKIKIDKREIIFTKEEAKVLYEELRSLFQKETNYLPCYPYHPVTTWSSDTITIGGSND